MSVVANMSRQRGRQTVRRRGVLLALSFGLIAMVALTLMLGQSFTDPATLVRVFSGAAIPGVSFTVMDLRLPRAVMACVAGASFGMGGAAFQTMLRNPLASPDIIGISTGASTAAVFAIVVFSLNGAAVSVAAILGGLGVALLIYLLSWRQGVSGTRLILVGIGLSAMFQSATAYLLTQAPSWTLQEALRWMTGSLNSATMPGALTLCLSLLLFGALLMSRARDLEALRLGDDLAAGLGVRLSATRVLTILTAVGLVASATALTGPIAFVAFLSGPISARLMQRFGAGSGSGLLPAALTGALLVIMADYAGQFLLPARYPVGIITGVLGAPYLIYLIMRDNRRSAS
ncbi:FecCD family ABC transporter permease [Celeribacter sp.]|uniref:FecCD family ABC transporter permease n=1 Tax=Celeribacter sp. TaxID=1890673 RepID=UPI003A93961E